MPKRVTVLPHLSGSELESRYRQAKDPVERTHYQIVWLLASGKTTQEVAQVTGYSLDWIRKIVRRYNQTGIEGLGDRRHDNPGGEPLLSEAQQAQLWQALHGPAPDGGLWNSRKVAEWISAQINRPVAMQRGWDYLQQMGFRLNGERESVEEVSAPQQRRKKTLKGEY
ncbi:helix-turn-helix domain-containing protein [Ancylothrix sp. C2]|uniref:helix-turn-helix domain-containing protein n=1 Tax=Ancylothrix sp. D3o TaxID=2953691 RepID=UPI0021BADB8E|nr:helix-turn-helix domain-containing protein [Ancylothrix sp. D3o]MCT7949779.1 helix-turn-helix domain-containing protein [Ancylothrix sp. D3o]